LDRLRLTLNHNPPKGRFQKVTSENPDFIFCSAFPNLRLGQPSETSPLFFDNLPHWGENFYKHFKVDFVVDTFVEMFEMEIVEKKGTSFRRLVWGA
jgi:hypothetical protein